MVMEKTNSPRRISNFLLLRRLRTSVFISSAQMFLEQIHNILFQTNNKLRSFARRDKRLYLEIALSPFLVCNRNNLCSISRDCFRRRRWTQIGAAINARARRLSKCRKLRKNARVSQAERPRRPGSRAIGFLYA